MPTGCSFHPRCPRAFEPCATDIPVLGIPVTATGSSTGRGAEPRSVACWLHETRPTS
jgi:ABC-type dipeptide/oligopeptide/nickel transport system ATPase component